MTLGPLAPELGDARSNLEIALHGAVPATWDDSEDYIEARQPREQLELFSPRAAVPA